MSDHEPLGPRAGTAYHRCTMMGMRIGAVASVLIVPALALSGCGSSGGSSSTGPDASADGGGAVVDVPSICQSPLVFPSNFASPIMCPGVVLETAIIPFDPSDLRWSARYQACLANYKSWYESDDCIALCTTLIEADATLRSNQGVSGCSLDCSQLQGPVLSVKYSSVTCDYFPDGGPQDVAQIDTRIDAPLNTEIDAALDAGVDGASQPGLDGALDVATALDANDVASDLKVELRTAFAWANCMPMISEDPILVTWTVDITGARGDTARLTKATIVVNSASDSIAQDFTVANPTIPLADGAGSADQRKPVAAVSPNSACSSMCGDATYELGLVYEIDGQSIAVNESGDFMCAY